MPTARPAPAVFLAHAFYFALAALATAVLLPRWLWRARRDPAQARLLAERFGRLPAGAPAGAVWIHAVSVGEVKAVRPLVAELLARDPQRPLAISTATITGHATARAAWPDLYVFHSPVDLLPVVRGVVKALRPRLLLLVELEAWPALLRAADEAGVPVAVVNGRITERSFRRYRRFRRWLPEFDRLSLVAAQAEDHARRFMDLGVPAVRIDVTGNLKHDATQAVPRERVEALAAELGLAPGADRLPVIVAGSTHPGEEAAVVAAWRELGGAAVAELLLVPRHVERCDDLERELRDAGVETTRLLRDVRAAARPRPRGRVALVDVIGELEALFGLADVVFLGGSLVPVGGHNVLEPALAGCPVLVGPQLEGCRREAEALRAAGGLVICADAGELTRRLRLWLGDVALRRRAGTAARAAALALGGAARATADRLAERGLLPGLPAAPPTASGALDRGRA